MREEERKYPVGADFALPDLAGAVPPGGRLVTVPELVLTATYLDTADLRLARAGVSLRHRVGDAEPWTVKLPTGTAGVRHEISRSGDPDTPPADLTELVTVHARGATLAPVAVLRTRRRAYRIHDRDDRVLVEVADDAVEVLEGPEAGTVFREIEVERRAGDGGLLDRIGQLLRAAGAGGAAVAASDPASSGASAGVAKHVRALGPVATTAPDRVPPGPSPDRPTAGDVVTAAIRRNVARLLDNDPLVRLRAPLPDEPGDRSPAQQMRVGCRRLRSDLRTFRRLLDPQWAEPLRAELSWLAGVLGAARDVEVLRARLGRTATADPLHPPDAAAVDRIDAALAEAGIVALARVDAALRSARYLDLVESLVAATRTPELTDRATAPAGETLPRLAARSWRRLIRSDLTPDTLRADSPDDDWHAVRIRVKRARYALKAVAPVAGTDARELARALGEVQDLLGAHQDAAVAAESWTALAHSHPVDHELVFTAGRLAERERAAVRAVRAEFPAVWRSVAKKGHAWA